MIGSLTDMYVETKYGRVWRPTEEESAEINQGIAADPDTYELTDEQIDNLKPWDQLQAEMKAAKEAKNKGGRPKADVTKEHINIRLSRDVLDAFRATGKGWQTRIDEVLKEWINEHPQ